MTFLSKSNTLPLPAGVLAICPLLDITGSFPSAQVDTGLDWLPCQHLTPFTPKPSEVWPPAKPRFGFYTDCPLHPLVCLSLPCKLIAGFTGPGSGRDRKVNTDLCHCRKQRITS